MLRWRCVTALFVLLIPFLTSAVTATVPGQWTQWRNTSDLVGHQALAGDITQETVRIGASLFVSGSTDPMPLLADIDGDGTPEIFMIDAGRVTSISASGERLWMSEPLQAKNVYGVVDVDGDGTYEVLVSATKAIVVLDAHSGRTLITERIPEDIQTSRFIFGDFNRDGFYEIVYYPYKHPFINVYQFSDDSGSLTLHLVSRIIDERSENAGGFSAYYPQLAATDLNDDGLEEIILSSWARVDVYGADDIASGRAGGVDELPALDEQSESPVPVASSEYLRIVSDAEWFVDGVLVDSMHFLFDEDGTVYGTVAEAVGDVTIDVTFKSDRYVTGVQFGFGRENGAWPRWIEVQTFDPFEGEWISQGRRDFAGRPEVIEEVRLDDLFIGKDFKVVLGGIEAGEAPFTLSRLRFMELNPLITPTAGRVIQGGVLADAYGPMNLFNGREDDYYFSEYWPTTMWPEEGLTTILEFDVPGQTVLSGFRTVDFWTNVALEILPDGESDWTAVVSAGYNGTKIAEADFSASPIVVPSNGKIRFKFFGGPYETTGYPNTPTVGDDRREQPTYYTRGTEIYLFRPMGKSGIKGVEPISRVEHMPHLADNGRNYGLKIVKDLDGDGLKEITMLNDGVSYHIGVYTADRIGSISLVGDQYFGYSAKANPDDNLPGRFAPGLIPEFYVPANPLVDIDLDGKDEMIYAVFTSRPGQTTGEWRIYVADPLRYDTEHWKFEEITAIDGYYLIGVTHMLGDDEPPVLLLSPADSPVPAAGTDVEFWTFEGKAPRPLGSLSRISVLKRAEHPPFHTSDGSRNGERRLYTVDVNGDGKEEVFVSRSGRFEALSIDKSGAIEVVLAIDGALGAPIAHFTDGEGSLIFLTNASGQMHAVDRSGKSLWSISFGGYLTTGTTVGDIDGDLQNEMIFTHGGRVYAYRLADGEFKRLWDVPGRGKNVNGGPSAVPLADMNGDGILDVVSVTTDEDGAPMFQVLDGFGNPLWRVRLTTDLKGNPLGNVSITDYVIGDMNGDGIPDILFDLTPGYPNGRTGVIDGATRSLIHVTPLEWLAIYPPEYDRNYNVMRSTYPTPGHYSMADVDGDGKMEGYFISLETAYRLKHVPATPADVAQEELVVYNVTGNYSGTYSRPLTMIDGQTDAMGDGKSFFYWQGDARTSSFVVEFAQVNQVVALETYGTADQSMVIFYADPSGEWHKVNEVPKEAFDEAAGRHAITFDGYIETDRLKVEVTAPPEALPRVSEIKVYGRQPETFRLDSYVGTIETGNLPVYYNSIVFVDAEGDGTLESAMTGGFNAFSVFKEDLFQGYMTTPLVPSLWHVLMPPLAYNPDMTVNTRGDSDLVTFRRQQGFADVDGDGKLEIALQYTTGRSSQYSGFMYVYSAEGAEWSAGKPDTGPFRFDQRESRIEWTYDMKPEFGENVMVYNITSADIDGDGLPEFIVTTNTGYVIAFNGESDPKDGRIAWSLQVGGGTDLQMPSIADIDNDGFSEIVVPASDGHLHVIDGGRRDASQGGAIE